MVDNTDIQFLGHQITGGGNAGEFRLNGYFAGATFFLSKAELWVWGSGVPVIKAFKGTLLGG